jgi:hypothetical protein
LKMSVGVCGLEKRKVLVLKWKFVDGLAGSEVGDPDWTFVRNGEREQYERTNNANDATSLIRGESAYLCHILDPITFIRQSS